MTLSNYSVWEIRVDGNDDNGGGFASDASGVDRSQQADAHVDIDGSTITAAVHASDLSKVVLTGVSVSADDVGNFVQITGGDATAGVYEILVVDTNANTWEFDRVCGSAGQSVIGKMGGALATPGYLAGLFDDYIVHLPDARVRVWVKSGTYNLSTDTLNVSGGPVKVLNRYCWWQGYETTRGDRGARPVLHANGVSVSAMFSFSPLRWQTLCNFEIDGDNVAQFGFVSASSDCGAFQVVVKNCTVAGYNSGSHLGSIAENCPVGFRHCRSTSLCLARDCTSRGYEDGDHFMSGAINCGFGVYLRGYYRNAVNCWAIGCTYGIGSNVYNNIIINCVAWQCDYGFAMQGGSVNQRAMAINCAAGGSIVEDFYQLFFQENCQTLTETPFTDSDAGDFSLNDLAGGGRICKDLGVTLPTITNPTSIGPFSQTDQSVFNPFLASRFGA